MAPKALNSILEKDLRAKVAMEDFWLEGKNYGYGTIMIPVQNQKLNKTELFEFFKELSEKKAELKISAIQTGMTQGY